MICFGKDDGKTFFLSSVDDEWGVLFVCMEKLICQLRFVTNFLNEKFSF